MPVQASDFTKRVDSDTLRQNSIANHAVLIKMLSQMQSHMQRHADPTAQFVLTDAYTDNGCTVAKISLQWQTTGIIAFLRGTFKGVASNAHSATLAVVDLEGTKAQHYIPGSLILVSNELNLYTIQQRITDAIRNCRPDILAKLDGTGAQPCEGRTLNLK